MPSANEHEALKYLRVSESKSLWLQQSIEITYSLIRAHSNRTVWTLLYVSACMLRVSLHVYYEAPLTCDAGSSQSGLLFHSVLCELSERHSHFSQGCSPFSTFSQQVNRNKSISTASTLQENNTFRLLLPKIEKLFLFVCLCCWSQLDVGAAL